MSYSSSPPFGGVSPSIPMSSSCINTTGYQCVDSSNCMHYTCPDESTAALQLSNIPLKCALDKQLTCRTRGNEAFCACMPILDPCPAGLVARPQYGTCNILDPETYLVDNNTMCPLTTYTYNVCNLPEGCTSAPTSSMTSSMTTTPMPGTTTAFPSPY